jgi:hypothetical protein
MLEGLTDEGMVFAFIILGIALLLSVASLVCYFIVLVKMFKNQHSALAIASILLVSCSGVGLLIAFVKTINIR